MRAQVEEAESALAMQRESYVRKLDALRIREQSVAAAEGEFLFCRIYYREWMNAALDSIASCKLQRSLSLGLSASCVCISPHSTPRVLCVCFLFSP